MGMPLWVLSWMGIRSYYLTSRNRAIEISQAFDDDDFIHFDRIRRPDVLYAGMMQYDGDLNIPNQYLVAPPQIDGSVAEYMCESGIKTLAISETQKYGHVTFFWNGNKSGKVNDSLEDCGNSIGYLAL